MVGSTISHYKILSKLGEGGMGVVYRAEDTKLDRQVALKFLPAHLLGNADIRTRFEREAKAAASLHHPNICPVYEIDDEDGKSFISMALIEGESLDKKISQGPLKLDEALAIAEQVARGLAAAHEKGVVHRDIKPENIIVDSTGHATIMDFGLAQLTEASRLTRLDETVGTTAYMSPEQTQGSGTDHRSDIWSLGVVLYEMVAGQQPFKGDYDKAIMYSILNEEPEPPTTLRTGVPMELEFILGKCLAKGPDERYGSAAELAQDLRSLAGKQRSGRSAVLSTAASETVQRDPGTSRWTILWPAVAASLAVLSAWLWLSREPARESAAFRFALQIPEEQRLDYRQIDISPDGSRIVYVANSEGVNRVYLALEDFEPRVVAGTEDASLPFFSADGEWIGFYARGSLWKASVQGGRPVEIIQTGSIGGLEASWSATDKIIYSPGISTGLFAVDADGGEPVEIATPDKGAGEVGYNAPYFLPDGRTLLFELQTGEGAHMAAMSLETGRHAILLPNVASPYRMLDEETIVYGSDGSLWSVPFDPEKLEIEGEARPLLDGLRTAGGRTFFDLAPSGTLAYLPPANNQNDAVLKVVDPLSGRTEILADKLPMPNELSGISLSPNGARVLASLQRQASRTDLWVFDFNRNRSRQTAEESVNNLPIWLPDSEHMIFNSTRAPQGVYRKKIDSDEPAELVLERQDRPQFPASVSLDGKTLFFHYSSPDSGRDLWSLDLTFSNASPRELLVTPFEERRPMISPNGEMLAYESNRSGGNAVYVAQYPSMEGRIQVTAESGGRWPRWSRDSKTLYYRDGGAVMAAEITNSALPSVGERRVYFDGGAQRWAPWFEVTPDGRLVMVDQGKAVEDDRLLVIRNWDREVQTRLSE